MQAYNVYSQLLRADTAIGATVATTVAGLGTATDGKIGLIRAGSTPFDFVQVIYDATYAKWVSPVVASLPSGWGNWSAGSPTTASMGLAGAVASSTQHHLKIVQKVFTDAGLTLQFRF